ncbi:hypothetical protein C8F01DRAFT_1130878 [Mycena amicta]|nr:hypothetical protein C8F01DRAFT_1130878 [Mycena amicta]
MDAYPTYVALKARLDALDASIESVKDGSQALYAERKAVALEMNAMTYLLPFEVTSSIFGYCVLASSKPQRHPARQLHLASVCSSWRDICFSLGYLWTSLHVYTCPRLHWSGNYDGLAAVARRWISRAGSYGVDLHIDEAFLSWDAKSKVCGIIPHVARFLRTLDMPVTGGWFLGSSICCTYPRLHTLVLRNSPDRPLFLANFEVHAVIQVDAPLLRTVKLHRPQAMDYALPWKQLTHLELLQTNLGFCLEILLQTPMLDTLVVLFSTDAGGFFTIYVTLPYLQTLRVVQSARGLLSHLTLPTLKSLELIEIRGRDVVSLVRDLGHQFSSSHPPTLRHLGVVLIDSHSLRDLLPLLPFKLITALDIAVLSNDRHFKDILLPFLRTPVETILPRLKTLKIKACPADVSARELVAVVQPRFATGVLREFSLDLGKQHDVARRQRREDEMILAFWELSEEGLSVEIQGELL